MTLGQLQHATWIAARTLGDAQAARRGRLPRRLARRQVRQVRRNLTGPLTDRFWRAIFR